MNQKFEKMQKDNEDLRIDFKTMLEILKQSKELGKKNVLETQIMLRENNKNIKQAN